VGPRCVSTSKLGCSFNQRGVSSDENTLLGGGGRGDCEQGGRGDRDLDFAGVPVILGIDTCAAVTTELSDGNVTDDSSLSRLSIWASRDSDMAAVTTVTCTC
jgi:hypothetical protein